MSGEARSIVLRSSPWFRFYISSDQKFYISSDQKFLENDLRLVPHLPQSVLSAMSWAEAHRPVYQIEDKEHYWENHQEDIVHLMIMIIVMMIMIITMMIMISNVHLWPIILFPHLSKLILLLRLLLHLDHHNLKNKMTMAPPTTMMMISVVNQDIWAFLFFHCFSTFFLFRQLFFFFQSKYAYLNQTNKHWKIFCDNDDDGDNDAAPD